ncbi:MAG: dinitrogenase iron-molybdenum cofactor biosynthesis protein [Vicinamibacteraceae bacterium]|nr:dinitrogenase iron-molybdenum cofactor biosynthesis protein [Vicinamibacteraceae bacterium]
MRLAIPEWQGRVSPVFDVAERVLVLDIDDGREVGRTLAPLAERVPAARARALASLGVTMLVCGAISRALEDEIAADGVGVVSQVTGSVDEVASLVARRQPIPGAFLMPGCRRPRVRAASRRGR